jgi:hypothetical protein
MRFVWLLFFLAVPAVASYRVHQLRVQYASSPGVFSGGEVVLSTMDGVQYELYHGGTAVVRVQMLDTWYCPGDTSRHSYCPKPRAAPSRGPASTDPKRLPLNRQPILP